MADLECAYVWYTDTGKIISKNIQHLVDFVVPNFFQVIMNATFPSHHHDVHYMRVSLSPHYHGLLYHDLDNRRYLMVIHERDALCWRTLDQLDLGIILLNHQGVVKKFNQTAGAILGSDLEVNNDLQGVFPQNIIQQIIDHVSSSRDYVTYHAGVKFQQITLKNRPHVCVWMWKSNYTSNHQLSILNSLSK